ncbi:MAG: HEAT repeat domain-containing protein [Proteobacteria bacterium]|jgi:HEAT repeat protein|nr:HEAT repeat domain-containing protein [Pseudomonadota bacterium]
MKDENFSDSVEGQDEPTPDESASPLGSGPIDPMLDPPDGEYKAAGGNAKVVIVLLILLLGGAALAYYFYNDNKQFEEWKKKQDDATALAKKGDDAGYKAALRAIAQECDRKDILLDVVYSIGVEKDKEAVPLLVKLLERGDGVSEEAAMALATIGPPEGKAGADAIFKQMQAVKDVAKGRYAWALCALGDERGMTDLLEAVGKQIANTKTIHGWDPAVIARMATTDRLIQMADSENDIVQFHAAQELGFRKDKDTIPALIKLMESKGRNTVVEAAVALGRSNDERARKALVDKLRGDDGLVDLILTTVTASVGAPGLQAIYEGLPDIETKFKVINKFKELRDPRAADFLVKVLNEKLPDTTAKQKLDADNIHNQALWALEDLGDPRIADKMYEKTAWVPATDAQIPDPGLRYRQNDMYRRLANGVPSWFAKVRPEGAADYLQKIYDANQPYANTPECAQRVKVDIGPLMDAMGRTGDQRFCDLIKPFLDQDENFHYQAASLAIARLKCPFATEEFVRRMVMTKTERKEELFSTSIETREYSMETRLQERRNSIIGSRYVGDAKASETLMSIALDPMDDPELRTEAAISLAYMEDEKTLPMILEKVKDNLTEIGARTILVEGLAHNPSSEAIPVLFDILEKETDVTLMRAAAITIGEAADPANDARLNKLLDDPNEDRQRVAAFAVLLGGSTERVDRVIEILLKGQETRLLLKEWFEARQPLLTDEMFEKKRIFRRLAVAQAVMAQSENKGEAINWGWRYLLDRLKNGWDNSPGGLNAREIRDRLADAVRKDAGYRQLAADTLAGLIERGTLLALQGEDGPQSAVARATLDKLSAKSQ